MKKIIIFCLVVVTTVLSIWQWDVEISKYEYLVSLWPVSDMPLGELGIMENIELRSYNDEPSTITYNLVSKDILENMVRRCSEFITGEWEDLGKDKPLIMENGIMEGGIPVRCSIDTSNKYMKTSFELQIAEADEFISSIYEEESLSDVLLIHELLDDALAQRHLTFYMEEYITLSYIYDIDDGSAMQVMDYYKDSLDGAEVPKTKLRGSEPEQSIMANVDGTDIRVSFLDSGGIEIWYELLE